VTGHPPDGLIQICREALNQVARAESWSMAAWLAERPDGGTVKRAYAEAARRARALDRGAAAQDRDLRDRERRPALVLTRELRECLTRLAMRLENGQEHESERLAHELGEVSRLVATPPPPMAWRGAGGGVLS
jgi:hypothetical protein